MGCEEACWLAPVRYGGGRARTEIGGRDMRVSSCLVDGGGGLR